VETVTSDDGLVKEVSELDLAQGDTLVLTGYRMRRYDRIQEESWTYEEDVGPALVISQEKVTYHILTVDGSVRRLHVKAAELVIPVQVSSDVW
jgi:hypothetical protein